MNEKAFQKVIDEIVEKDCRYARDAYAFVNRVVFYLHKKRERQKTAVRNITGPELLEGFRELAIEEFGPLALAVLKEWGILSGLDVGHIVFTLVDHQVLSKTANDSLEDFRVCYAFAEAFTVPFLPTRKKASAPPIIA